MPSARLHVAALLLAGGCLHHPPQPPAASAPPSLEEVDAAALQGDEREALRRLARIAPDRLPDPERARRACLLRTFVEHAPAAPEVTGTFAPEIAAIYQAYWSRVLLGEATPEAGAAELQVALRGLLERAGRPPPAAATLDDLTEALGPVLEADGYHSIRGVTLPYHELILWRRETARAYQVSLPEGQVAVKVVFMDGFAVRGWSGFATCGASFAGGWTTDEALYCVADAYDTGSETFQVSYLAHEGQHFRDRATFPGWSNPSWSTAPSSPSWRSPAPRRAASLARFAGGMGDDRSSPHAWASRRVVAALSRALLGATGPVADETAWAAVPVERVNAAARELLLEDSRERSAAGGR